MTRRKGEIAPIQLDNRWPHHVALPAEAFRVAATSVRIYRIAKVLGAPRPYHTTRDSRELVVFCFATPETAQAFGARFGGELLPALGESQE